MGPRPRQPHAELHVSAAGSRGPESAGGERGRAFRAADGGCAGRD